MKTWKKHWVGLAALAGLTPNLWAQVPVAPPPVPAVPAPAAAVPVVPVAPPRTLWSFLGLTPEQCARAKAACKAHLCATPLGQLLNNTLKPVTALSGGLIPEICPPLNAPNPADLAKPAASAEGAAARIKQAEAEAKARRAAIRYLGTVDCNWYPEAEKPLIDGLRKDPNECVRLEAAWAMNRGCCCTKAIIAALTDSVSGGKKFGMEENSERVKDAAAMALEHCLACNPQVPEEEPKKPPELPKTPPEQPKGKQGTGNDSRAQLADPFKELETVTLKQVIEQAHRALAERHQTVVATAVPPPPGGRSVYSIVAGAMSTPPGPGKLRLPESKPVISSQLAAADVPATQPPSASDTPSIIATTFTAKPGAAKSPAEALNFPAPGATSASLDQLVTVLRRATYAEQRTWAADNLAVIDWQTNPQAVNALLSTAREDAAPAVRVACIRCLAKMGANSPVVLAALHALKRDADVGVRHEAEAAVAKLSAGQPGFPTFSVQPLSALKVPSAYRDR